MTYTVLRSRIITLCIICLMTGAVGRAVEYPCNNTTAEQLPGKTLWLQIAQATPPFENAGMYALAFNANGTYSVAAANGVAARSGTWVATNWTTPGPFTFVDVVLTGFFNDSRLVKVFVDHCFYEIHFIPHDGSVYQYGYYRVTDGSVPSPEAPQLLSSPYSQTHYTGETVALAGAVRSTELVHYQWFKNGSPISWGTGPFLTLTNLAFADAGGYSFTGSNSLGMVTSAVAVLTVASSVAPSGTSLISYAQTNLAGSTFYLYGQAVAVPLTTHDVRWYRDGVLLGDATNNFSTGASNLNYFSFTATNAQSVDSGNYYFVASNLLGAVTSAPLAMLITNATLPTITTNLFLWPYSSNNNLYVVFPAYNYTLATKAVGTAPLNYYWYKDGVRITTTSGGGAPFPANDNVSVLGPGVGTFTYQVVVSNVAGSVTGAPMTLTVLPDYPVVTRQTSSFTNLFGSSNYLSFEYYSYVTVNSIQWKNYGSTIFTTNASGTNFVLGFLTASGSYSARLIKPSGAVYDTAPIIITVTNGPAVITRFTQSQTQYYGGTLTLGVDYIMGSPAGVTHHWYKNGAHIPGNDMSLLYLNSLVATNSGNYQVILSNALGSVTSSVATLTVQAPPPPIITNQPTNLTAYAGSGVIFTVGFANYDVGTAQVQWYKTNILQQSSTSPTYTMYNVSSNNSGGYYAVVSNGSGSSTSQVAVLTVVQPPPPTITNQPQSLAVYAGSNVVLNIGFINLAPLGANVYWYRNGVMLGANTSWYLYNITTNSAGNYQAVVSNSGGATTSDVAEVSVTPPPVQVITKPPQSVTNYPGGTVTFTVGYTNVGPGGVTFNWLKNGGSQNYNSDTYFVNGLTTNSAANFQAVVINAGGAVTSAVATLTVVPPPLPVITNHPINLVTNSGAFAYFIVGAQNLDPKGAGYAWYKDGVAIPGALGFSLSFSAVRFANAGNYFVVVTNTSGAVTSFTASLTVQLPAAPAGVDNSFFMEDGPNSSVNAILPLTNGNVVVGGFFTDIGPTNRYGVAQFTASGSHDTNFAPVLGSGSSVYALQSDPTGSVLVAGNSTTPFYSVGRLLSTGARDTNYNAAGNALMSSPVRTVYTVVRTPEQRVLIAGYFSVYNNVSRASLALLETNGQLVTNFNAQLTSTQLRAVVVQPDGKILIGGQFTKVGATNRFNFARLNADGSYDLSFATNAGVAGSINAIALQPDGKVIIGGDFNNVGGISRNRIARFNSDGTLDLTFAVGTGFNNSVNALAVLPSNGKVIVGGYFTSYNGTNRSYLVRLNTNGVYDTAFAPAPNNAVNVLTLGADGALWIGGDFTQISGVARPRLAKLYGDPLPVVNLAINTPVFSAGSVNFSLVTVPGRDYAIQYINTLGGTNWGNVTTFTGDGGTRTITNALSGTMGFYRVIVAP
jgi:uncharacterized delta-60 repeat protein